MRDRPIEILLIEDNPGDVRLTKEALKDSKIKNNLEVVESGVHVHEALSSRRQNGERLPDVVLLDLDLPGKSGAEILAELKGDELLRSIPVVVLTSSEAEEDIARTYDLHANCYLTKPLGLEQFVKMVRSIEDFWFSIVKLPGDS